MRKQQPITSDSLRPLRLCRLAVAPTRLDVLADVVGLWQGSQSRGLAMLTISQDVCPPTQSSGLFRALDSTEGLFPRLARRYPTAPRRTAETPERPVSMQGRGRMLYVSHRDLTALSMMAGSLRGPFFFNAKMPIQIPRCPRLQRPHGEARPQDNAVSTASQRSPHCSLATRARSKPAFLFPDSSIFWPLNGRGRNSTRPRCMSPSRYFFLACIPSLGDFQRSRRRYRGCAHET